MNNHVCLDPASTSNHAEVLTDLATTGLPADERANAMARTRELVRVVNAGQRELLAAFGELNTWLAKLKREVVEREDDGG